MAKQPSIYERSGGRFIPLGGKSRRYIDTFNPNGPTVSRRQVDNILHGTRGYEEKRVKSNKAANPKLSKQRPARGRPSTLPKPKPAKKKKRAAKKAKKKIKTTKMIGKTGTYFKRTYSASKIGEVESFLNYHRSRGGRRWYAIGHFSGNVKGMKFDRTIIPAADLRDKISIQKELEQLKKMLFTMNGPDNSYKIKSVTVYVMYPPKD